uniref:Putative secreted protein n=1 Tax=Ixodes ricinus TaxID=34613 RepID=A0A147BQI9_IXORI
MFAALLLLLTRLLLKAFLLFAAFTLPATFFAAPSLSVAHSSFVTRDFFCGSQFGPCMKLSRSQPGRCPQLPWPPQLPFHQRLPLASPFALSSLARVETTRGCVLGRVLRWAANRDGCRASGRRAFRR